MPIGFFRFLKGVLLENETDTTKTMSLEVSNSATTGTSTTIQASQTANRTITLPDSSDTLATLTDVTSVGDDLADHIADTSAHGTTGDVVGTTDTQTLTNKTLTGNIAANLISGSGTLVLNTTGTITIPNSTDTLVGKATSDILTNKTIVVANNTITTAASGNLVATELNAALAELQSDIDSVSSNSANKTLSNLTSPTSINQHLLPSTTSIDLGSTASNFRNTFSETYSITTGSNTFGGLLSSAVLPSTTFSTGAFFVGNGTSSLANYTVSNAAANATPTGSIHLETGNKTGGTGNSGNIVLRVGTSSGGTRGKVKFVDGSEGTVGHVWTQTAADGSGAWQAGAATGANTSLSNLTSPTSINQDLRPNGDNAFSLGSPSFKWDSLYTQAVRGTTSLSMQTALVLSGSSNSSPISVVTGEVAGGTGNTGALTLRSGTNTAASSGGTGASILQSGEIVGNATGDTGAVTVQSGNTNSTSSSSDTGSVTVKSGNSTTGNSGAVVLQTGTAGTTRGKIRFVDGSEGTAGFVWTSTDTLGNGAWVSAGGGGGANFTLSNLVAPTSINESLTFDNSTPGALLTPDQTSGTDVTTNAMSIRTGSLTGTVTGTANVIGDITISTGDSALSGIEAAMGSVTVKSGNFSNGDFAQTGSVLLESGSNTAGDSGLVRLRSGATTTGGGGNSGAVQVRSGNSVGQSGNVSIIVGDSSGGNAGQIQLLGGTGNVGGSIYLQSGVGDTSTSGDIILEPHASFVTTRGKIRFVNGTEGTSGHVWTSNDTLGGGAWAALPAAGANTTLSNLGTTSINSDLLPSASGTRQIGSTTLRWLNMFTGAMQFYGSSEQKLQILGNDSVSGAPSGLGSGGAAFINLAADNAGFSTNGIVIYTNNNATASANQTGNVLLETGNKTAGTGDSGFINIQTGTSSGGNRGIVSLNGRYIDTTSKNIKNVADPVDAQDAATKNYVLLAMMMA